MAFTISKRRETLAGKSKNGKLSKKSSAEDKVLAFIESELVTAEGRYMTPMIIDQLSYLLSMLDRADQLPGQDAYQRFEELEERLNALKPDYENYFSAK
jgi:predicted nucleic acid-binding protein